MKRTLVVLGIIVASLSIGTLAMIGAAELQVSLAEPEPCRDTFIIEQDGGPIPFPLCAAPTAEPVPTFAAGVGAAGATGAGSWWLLRRRRTRGDAEPVTPLGSRVSS